MSRLGFDPRLVSWRPAASVVGKEKLKEETKEEKGVDPNKIQKRKIGEPEEKKVNGRKTIIRGKEEER
mgnify:CR=1 FL=1|jgi:hypothetical protein